MSVSFEPAPEVWDIVQKIVADRRPELADVRIECVFREKAVKSHGHTVLGMARKISGLPAFLAQADGYHQTEGEFYVLDIAADMWDELTPAQREALVDHELLHCGGPNDKGALTMRGHDLEEFREIVERHGFWKPDIAQFAGVIAGQLSLNVDDLDPGDAP